MMAVVGLGISMYPQIPRELRYLDEQRPVHARVVVDVGEATAGLGDQSSSLSSGKMMQCSVVRFEDPSSWL